MPKLLCACDQVIELSEIPIGGEYYYLDAGLWDKLVASLAESVVQTGVDNKVLLREAISDTLAGYGNYFYRCSDCDRLIVVSDQGNTAEYFEKEVFP